MEPNRRTRALERAIERFPSLDTVASIYKVLAIICGGIGGIKVLYDLFTSLNVKEGASAAPVFASLMEAIYVGFAVVTMLAMSELVHLVLEASEHWRTTALRAGKLRKPSTRR
jgi:hypothetical protein